jgi:hypothetical protein
MKTLKLSTVEEALDIASIWEDYDIRKDYSGRGMYGKTCFGITFRRGGDSYRFMAAVTAALIAGSEIDEETGEDGQDVALELADAATADSMGLGMILYFPGWKLEG